jgi:hypothetical protein
MTRRTPVSGETPEQPEKLWRYMSFARFIWMLHKKVLWLSRADLLGDPWEIALAGDQLAYVISHHPPHDILSKKPTENARERSERIVKLWRRVTFVNCWSSSEHESHALWKIYCRSPEGVAVQTTFAKLRDSLPPSCSLLRVTYEVGKRKSTPTIPDLASKKRPMFEYEHEVRVVRYFEENAPPLDLPGLPIRWDAETNLESVRLSPEADDSFMETVRATVEKFAPKLLRRVEWSDMEIPPPF